MDDEEDNKYYDSDWGYSSAIGSSYDTAGKEEEVKEEEFKKTQEKIDIQKRIDSRKEYESSLLKKITDKSSQSLTFYDIMILYPSKYNELMQMQQSGNAD